METALPPARQIWAFLLLLLSISSVCRTQSIPFLSECQSGEAPVFLLQHNSSLAGTAPLRSVTVNGGFLECTELCSTANGGGPEPFSLESSIHFVLPIAADDDAVASPPPTPLFTRFRPSALLAQLVRAATAELLSNAAGHSNPLTANALANCTELTELIADLQDCVGVRYTAADSQCQLLGRTQGTEQQQSAAAAAAEGGRLVTKSCVKSKRICSSPFHFDVHEQKILVGFAREVVPAESAQQCLTACLDAFDTFGFECESVMFYPVDAECILNTEDRLDRPDLFVDEHEDTVIYMDNNCAGSQCYAPYVTQYVAVDGKQLADELDHTFEGMELAECEELCTQRLSVTTNDFNCKAFMYNKQSRNCILSDERSRPLGRANLSDAQGWTYHEKKCFASPRTCRNVPSFTRVPQMLLVGFASFVMENVPSVTMCLDQCTNPPPETGQNFVCKSVMYYYNEQECILNAESRHSKPDLFIPEEDDFVVDYFDINCRLEPEQCTDGRMAKLVRTLNAALPEGESAIHVLETMQTGVQECAQKCVEHAPDKCRSINFDKSSGTCNLLYLDGRGSLRPETKAQVDLYDVHCLNGPKEGAANNQHSPSGCVDPEGAIFSRNLYTRWVATSPSKELASVPLSKCLNLCSTAGEQCEGVNYNRRSGGCQMFTSLGGAAVDGQQREEEEKSEHVDFYRNVCRVQEIRTEESSGAANVPKTPPPTAAPQPQTGEGQTTKSPIRNLNNRTLAVSKPTISKPAPDFRHGPVKVEETTAAKGEEESGKVKPAEEGASKQFAVPTAIESAQGQQKPNSVVSEVVSRGQVDGKLSVKNEGHDPNAMPAPVLIPASEVHTICNYEGISVQIKHSEPFSGVVFVKNKYDSCRVEVEAKDSVTLVLGLPANFGMKPISLNPNPSAGHRKPKAQADATLAIGAANNGSDSSAESSAEQAAELATTAEAEAQQRKRARRQSSQRDCGLQDMDNGTYKTVVVVQTNNLGIPGLVTSMDQLYEISCNYSSMLGGKVQAAASLRVQGPQPSLIQPRGKIELGNPVLMQMSPVHRRDIGGTLQRDEGPLVQAKLGDILELRWEIMAMDEELDFFVRDCYAEPGISAPSKTAGASAAGGEANNSEKLQLIEAGCPTPAVAQKLIPNPISVLSSAVKIAHLQAFRFDSSSSVRITCHLELCKGDCKSVNCKLLDGVKESWGRKKRAAAVSPAAAAAQNGVTEFETRRYKVPRFAQATTSLVIIDPLQKFSDPLMAAPFQSHSSLSRLAADLPTASVEENNGGGNSSNAPGDLWLKVMPKSASSSAGQHRGELCLHKWTVGGVLGTLMALILIQSAVVAKYMFARLFADQSK